MEKGVCRRDGEGREKGCAEGMERDGKRDGERDVQKGW
jgi:hypothetical protein